MRQETKHYLAYILFTATVGFLLLLNWLGIFTSIFGIDTAILLALFGGYRIYYNAISALFEKRISADLAIVLAIGAALAIGQYVAAAEAVFIMLIGEGLEEFAAHRTRAAIEGLIKLAPKTARIKIASADRIEEQQVSIEDVKETDIVIVFPGERIPVDGKIIKGRSSINEAPITGESLPADKGPGEMVFAGTINTLGPLEIEATHVGEDTTLAQIISLVEAAEEKRAPVVRLADRYAKFFLPAILIAAALTLYFTGEWVRAVAVLLVACPCALILATPAAVVAGIGRLAREGVLVKSGLSLETVARVDCFVFDKTGTITEGNPTITRITPLNSHSEDELLQLAALAEQSSEHAIARLIVRQAQLRGLPIGVAEEFKVDPGLGVAARANGNRILVGNRRLMEAENIGITEAVETELAALERAGESAVLIATGGAIEGLIGIQDRPRAEAKETIKRLKAAGIKRTVLLTGDRLNVALSIGRRAGVDEVHAELLPQAKVELIGQLQQSGQRVVMVGDGINDAPALAAADVGIAMGLAGTDITIEEADIVLMNDRLDRLPLLVEVSRATLAIISQNILVFALVVNIAAVLAASSGLLSPVGAAATHQVAALLVVLNSLRLLVYGRVSSSRWVNRAKTLVRATIETAREYASAVDLSQVRNWIVEHRLPLTRRVMAALLLLYLLSGIYLIGPDEVGLVRRFGRKILPLQGPGIHYRLPWPIEQVTKLKPNQIQVAEIGFRTVEQATQPEPAAYEWNIQHRTGRYEKKQEEALMLTGDENLIEVNAVVQYTVGSPDDYLFSTTSSANLVHVASESALRSLVGSTSLDQILTTGRQELERQAKELIQSSLDLYRSGLRVLVVQLQEVHPSVAVVDAFRNVSAAFEEKLKLINEAESYRNEQLALARGQALARLAEAAGYTTDRANRAAGDAERFKQAAAAFKRVPQVTETRLYLETIEQVLAGRKKLIIDGSKLGRQQMLFIDPKGVPLDLRRDGAER
jgi:Cu+-exporting ATPase